MIYNKTIEGKYVDLKYVTVEDAAIVLELRQDPELTKYLPRLDITEEEQKEWIRKQQLREGDYYFSIVRKSGEKIGLIRVYDIKDDEGETGSFLSRGTLIETREAKLLFDEFLFITLGLKKIRNTCRKDNESILNFSESFGVKWVGEKIDRNGYENWVGNNTYEQSKPYRDVIRKEIYGDEETQIIPKAVELYGNRVISTLSNVIDYIDFSSEKEIVKNGKLDSLGLLKIVTALNNEFGIKIPYYEIKPSNFENKNVISTLIWKVINNKTKNCITEKEITMEVEEDDEFVVPDRSLPKRSFVEQIYINSITYPDKIAIVSDGEEYSYSNLFEFIKGYSNFLKGLGLNKGDMILAKANQSINYVVTYFASHLAGLEITTVEKNTSKESLFKMAEIVNAKVISTKNEDFGTNKNFIFVDSFDVLNHVGNTYCDLIFPSESDMADILFTTGTTGVSKGIELTHKAAVCGAENMASGAHMARHTVLICPNPLSHSNAIKQLAATMISGGTFYILDGITDLNAFFNALNYHSRKVSIVLPPSGIRTIFQLAKDEFASYSDRIEYLMAATAPLPEPDRETLRQMFPNSKLYNHYGCSESSTISIYDFNKYKELKNCVGIPTPNTNVMFVDDNRNIINSSKDNMGLLAVSGGTVMVGYYKDPEKTAEVLVDGVVYTKDVGYIDDNGFVFITGRNDDVINVGGLKVAPTEVESAAMGLDSIADCICIGVKDDVSGQALKLLIVPSSGLHMNSKEISAYLSTVLDYYKVPHIFEEVDHIERTYNGKINRKFYREK